MSKNSIAMIVGFCGGGVMMLLHYTVDRSIPGGGQGGAVGFMVFYALGWLVLAFFPPDIWQAVKKNNVERVKNLLSKRVDVNTFDDANLTPLAYAAAEGHLDIVKLLVDAGADLNAIRKNGTTPLMNAANRGHAEVVSFLLDKGADVSVKDNDGKLAADWAIDGGHADLGDRLRLKEAEE